VTPYFDDGQVTLFRGDFLTCPPVAGDVFLTDPPYARAGGVHSGRTEKVTLATPMGGADQFWLHWFSAVARRLARSCAPSGCGFVFTDYRTAGLVEQAFAASETGWRMTQCLVWDRDAIGMGAPFRSAHELIAFCRGPAFAWAGRRDLGNVLRFRWPYGVHPHHPAEKPVALLRFLIEATTWPGQAVLDPFAGSGSTLVAAKQCGRRALGVEAEERHCATSVRRLSQHPLPLGEGGGGQPHGPGTDSTETRPCGKGAAA
jgi:DNA modification methylase